MKTILRKRFPITATLLLLAVCTAAIAVTLPRSIFVSASASGGLSWLNFSQEKTQSLNAWYASGNRSSSLAFLPNPSADLDQCANDPAPSPNTDGCATSATQWVNGNLGASKSIYLEGDTIPYRMRFGSLSLASHTVIIEWDTTKSGKHAIDYITNYNQSVLDANPCLGVSGCSNAPGGFTTFTIPQDPQVTGAGVTPIAGVFRMYGGSITSVGPYTYSTGTGFAGDKSAAIAITFTATVANPVLAWGGHISTRKDWGADASAVAIPGSPYHTRLISLDGSGGNQDRSLSAQAVVFPGSITIIKDATPNGSTSFPFTASPSPLSNFSLVDDGTSANTKVFSTITNFQTYTVSESSVSGWRFDSASCSVSSANGGTQNVSGSTATINLAEGENVTCTYLNTANNPALSIVKTATETGFSHVGDVIHYSIVATNTGNTTLSSVTITDPNASNLTCTPANGSSLTAGATMSCTASHTITQADLDAGSYYNQACVDDGPGGAAQACSDVTTPGSPSPHLTIRKTATETSYSHVGDVIHYTIVATNDGNVTLSNVTVTDPNASGLTCTPANGSSLAPGASLNCTATHTITQADIDAGHYYNQACVDDGAGGAAQACSDVDTPGNKTPHLTITKTATESGYNAVGQIIHYTIVATNDGNVTLSNVAVTDAQVTNLSCTPTSPVASLAPGGTITCTASHTITQADLDAGSYYNQACVDDGPGGAAQACSDVTTPGTQNPHLAITKTATETGYSHVGDVIHYTIVATNDGNVTLSNVTVTDAQVTNLNCSPSNPVASLAPGGTISCTASHTVTQADIDGGSYYNQACVDDGPGGAAGKCADVTTPATQNPHLTITKTAAETGYNAVGQIIHYTIVATNDGNVTLNNVTVTDPNASGLTCTPANGSSLAPGASLNCTATHTITQADIDAGHYYNQACVDDGPGGAAQACGDVNTPGTQNPHLSITKTASPDSYNAVGQVISYTIVATNDGNVTLNNVTVTDPNATGLSCTPPNGSSLAPGSSLSCTASHTVTQADLDAGHYYNQACVDDGAGGAAQACSDVDTPGNKNPHLSITKTATESGFNAVGDVIHYTIAATNDGNVTLAAVTVTDPNASGLTCTPANGSTLAPGASMTCTATHTITQADLNAGSYYNQACVDDGPNGAAQACSDVTTPGTQNPHLSITKTATETGFSAVGNVIHYTIVATNDGNVTLNAVTVTDPNASGLTCTPANGSSLAPGASMTCTATHTIVQADIDAGSYYNQACVDDGAGGAAQACGDVTTPGSKNPHLSLTKTATETTYNAVGQVIHYTIVATNDGNVTLGSVTVTDANADNLTCTPANGSSLAPGASLTCTATHTITQADIDAGHYNNVACVDDGPGGAASVCKPADTPGSSTPDVRVVKTGNGPINAGDTATFTITVTSIGNATALNVNLSDTLPSGLSWTLGGTDAGSCSISGTSLTCSFGNMAPGASKTITVSAVTSAVNCGTLSNTANVSAVVDSNSSNNSSTATITVICSNPSGSYPTNTTCQNFISNTVVPQEDGNYSVKGNTINQANPGVIFYYALFTATGPIAWTNQAIERPISDNFGRTMTVQSANVFTSTCGSTNVGVTPAATADQTFPTEWGSQQDLNSLKLSNLIFGQQYVLQVKYSVSSLAGATAPKIGNTYTPIVFQFQTWNQAKTAIIAKDDNGFTLTKK